MVALLVFALAISAEAADRTRWVNPFIGMLREGSSHPGATWPMGMVQPGPEVGTAVPPPS